MYERHSDYEKDLALVSDPSVSEKVIHDMLKKHHGEIEIAKAIARNPGCPYRLFVNFWKYMQETASLNPKAETHQSNPNWINNIKSGPRIAYSKWSNDISERRPECYKAVYVMQHGDGKYQRHIMRLDSIPEYLIREHSASKSAPLRKVIAARQDLPKDIFDKLAQDSAKSVREVLANNPSTPGSVLVKLSQDKEPLVANAATGNPNCPDEAVHKARLEAATQNKKNADIDSLHLSTLYQLAGDINTDPSKLAELSDHEDPCIRFLIGFNQNTPHDILEKLADDKTLWVKAGPAFNPNTPTSTLEKLLNEQTKDIQIGLASNPSLGESSQKQLARIACDQAAYALANLTCHDSIYDILINDIKPAKKAKDKTWRHHLKDALAARKTGKFATSLRGPAARHCFVSSIAAKADTCPLELAAIYAHYCFDDYSKNPQATLALLEGKTHVRPQAYKDWKIDKWLSEKSAPGFVARFFIQSSDSKRRAQAVSAWTTPVVDLIPFVLDPDTNTRKRLAEREDLIQFVYEILARDEKSGVREQVANNIKTPKPILSMLANDKATTVRSVSEKRTQKKAPKGSNSNKDMVNQGSATERARLAKKTDDVKILEAFSEDKATSVRATVAEHRETPEEVLVKLSADPQAKVRTIIASRLKDTSIVHSMLTDKEKSVRVAAANNSCWYVYKHREKQFNQVFIETIANFEDQDIRSIAAQYSTDEKLHIKFMTDTAEVLVKLAHNKYLSDANKIRFAMNTDNQDALAALANKTKNKDLFLLAAEKITSRHADDPIRCHQTMLAKPEIQDRLCTHPLDSVRWALTRQTTLTALATNTLLEDENAQIKKDMQRRLK